MDKHIVFLGLGSNLGNRHENIKRAIEHLKDKIIIEKISSIIETQPYGFVDQPKFLNCVLKGTTMLSPFELLEFVLGIENKMGRIRLFKWGPRNIDIDILFYDDCVIDTENLKIPHPELHKRLFVLEPICEIEKDFVHPVLKKSVYELYTQLTSPRKE
ncbi:2-amino-4-hydroxy-6-hydroxymethyldihydropteridine pyrophosphokinase [Caldicellulosiruptor hydrothermalis 108]|uniref:2-amino-4-hydroxy-6-hydroxymethyldihydropteridine diphosphokinase n=1 Tax=Caldicellulosiruptor hydrothermalis (strain DSM 18901 / VKM B-2411 / 108) TaxID=632292 RepID=E4Q955_CALH1|nr:2-amino-4-hydroxy-6-hydroxymethyldihydropteridine diphosphokinase [Caldicellulosiruptor hydrothermalis]ADQ08104.1 2-amino-4-hydroxy-6-hydroxymethyldihydropteridine pyrophosphokinase [Caldicellulosiruptor hydrothermalis 108]